MTSIRLYYEKRGGHIHCRMFTGTATYVTHAKNGDLVFDENEWPDVKAAFEAGSVDVLPEVNSG